MSSFTRANFTATPTSPWQMPIQLIGLVAQELLQQGIPPETLLHGSGLHPDMFNAPDILISFEKNRQLLERALSLSLRPGLGLDVGNRQTPSGWGILGYAINCCANAREAMLTGARYNRIAASLNHLTLIELEDVAYWIAQPAASLGRLLAFSIEQEFVSFSRASSVLTGKPFRPREIHFSYPAPAYVDRYAEFFDAPLHFDAAKNQFILDRSTLDFPILQANPLSAATALRMCEEFLAAHPTTDDLIMKVRGLLLEKPGEFPDAETIAARLNMTSRTLRNQLARLNCHFQTILDDVRTDIAKNYLQQTPLKIDDVAWRLGFQDSRSFRRAFKKWTGNTPGDYRDTQSTIKNSNLTRKYPHTFE